MTNELPLNLYITLAIVDFVLILYTFGVRDTENYTHAITSMIASGLSYVLANMIISGKVVMTYATSSSYSYVPVQSLPVFYFFQGLGVVMTIYTAVTVYKAVKEKIESEKAFSAMGSWDGDKV